MVAFNYQAQFADEIESGEKTQTIRRCKKRKPPKPGQELQHYSGMQSKKCRLLRRTECKRVSPVLIDFKLLQVVIYDSETEAELQRLKGDEIVKFARSDGFDSVSAFFCYFESQADPRDDGLFFGYLIEWEV